jgi:hypothetical protein
MEYGTYKRRERVTRLKHCVYEPETAGPSRAGWITTVHAWDMRLGFSSSVSILPLLFLIFIFPLFHSIPHISILLPPFFLNLLIF